MDITMVIIKLDINMIIIEYSGGYKREDRKQNIQQMEEVTETVVEQGKVGNMQMPNQVDEYKWMNVKWHLQMTMCFDLICYVCTQPLALICIWLTNTV